MTLLTLPDSLQLVQTELEAGGALAKCQQCGCMASTLQNLQTILPTVEQTSVVLLAQSVALMLTKMRPTQYTCLGCEHCYPAVAQNAFGVAFPTLSAALADLSCELHVTDNAWPPVVGEYFVLDKTASVAVTTLVNVTLAAELAQRQPHGLALVGKTETENIGLDKIIKNSLASSTLRYLIVAGVDSQGHQAGQALLALAAHGVDGQGRVIGAKGKRPYLRNVTPAEIEAFRTQVQVVDMLGCEKADEIVTRIAELAPLVAACSCSDCGTASSTSVVEPVKLLALEPLKAAALDAAGYFVILPIASTQQINVEHYSYDNVLLGIIEGATARAIYYQLIENKWLTELSHAAYLGKELAKAELSLRYGFKYVQDGA